MCIDIKFLCSFRHNLAPKNFSKIKNLEEEEIEVPRMGKIKESDEDFFQSFCVADNPLILNEFITTTTILTQDIVLYFFISMNALNFLIYDIKKIKEDEDLSRKYKDLSSKYNILKNDNKISLTKLINVIEGNINLNIKDKENLIAGIRENFSHKIIDDFEIKPENFNNLINENNIKILDRLENWSEAIKVSGELLIKQNYVTKDYIQEMKELVEKFGSYIVVADGIAIPHGSIGKNVVKDGAALLILKEAVRFDDGEMVNIFIPFATRGKKLHSKLLNEIFDIIKRKELKNRILKLKTEQEVIEYLNR